MKLQPVDHQESAQQNRDEPSLPPVIAPILLLLPPLPPSLFVFVGFGLKPYEVAENAEALVEVELLPEITIVTDSGSASGSPIPRSH